MNRRNFPVQEFLLFLILIGSGAPDAAAGVKEAVLEVDLKNPGATVSKVQFFIQSMQLTNNIVKSITVQTPGVPINSAKNLFKTGSLTFDRQPTIDAYQLTLTPTKAFGPNQNVTFLMTVPGVNSLDILSGTINNNGNILGGAPAWFNNDSPPKQLVPGPTLPGFKVVTKDAAYTIYGDSNQPFGIQNLTFLPNITESQFEALNLNAVIAEEPNASLPDIPVLSSSATFTNLPDPAPGNLFIAVGQIVDTSGNVIGAFAEGVQTQSVPEPSTGVLLAIGLAGLFAVGWLRSRRDRKGDFTMTACRSSLAANPICLTSPRSKPSSGSEPGQVVMDQFGMSAASRSRSARLPRETIALFCAIVLASAGRPVWGQLAQQPPTQDAALMSENGTPIYGMTFANWVNTRARPRGETRTPPARPSTFSSVSAAAWSPT